MDKILEVSCNGLTNGGVQHVIMEIVKGLSEEYKFDILVFNDEEDEFYTKEFLSYGGKIFRIPNKKKCGKKDIDFYFRGLRIIKNTYKILKNNGPYKAIHCHNYFESALCLIAAKMAKVDIRIVHSHNDLTNVNYSKLRVIMQKKYQKIINKLATNKIGCSEIANKYLYGKGQNTKVVNNAIDLSKFKYVDKNIDKEKIRILHVGNFSTQKNQEFLIDIAQELKTKNIKFELTLVGGESDYKKKVIQKIKDLKFDDIIHILPQNTDIYNEMSEADLFLFPSKYEGLGIVLIEAQATGLHCMVSNAIPKEADLGNANT